MFMLLIVDKNGRRTKEEEKAQTRLSNMTCITNGNDVEAYIPHSNREFSHQWHLQKKNNKHFKLPVLFALNTKRQHLQPLVRDDTL